MRKKVFGRQLSRGRGSRRALFAALLKAVITNGKIVTTKARAQAVYPDLEKIVKLAKAGSVSQKRKAVGMLMGDREIATLLFDKVAPLMGKRESKFSKVTLLGPRRGDRAEMATLEWSEKVATSEKKEDIRDKKAGGIEEKKVKREKRKV